MTIRSAPVGPDHRCSSRSWVFSRAARFHARTSDLPVVETKPSQCLHDLRAAAEERQEGHHEDPQPSLARLKRGLTDHTAAPGPPWPRSQAERWGCLMLEPKMA